MRSGKMRYRLTLQRPKHDDRRRGGRTDWETVHVGPPESNGKIWGSIRQRRVAESKTTRNQLTVIGSYEIRLWAVPGLDETWRLLHGGNAYNIVSADPPRLTSNELVLICKRDKLKGDISAH